MREPPWIGRWLEGLASFGRASGISDGGRKVRRHIGVHGSSNRGPGGSSRELVSQTVEELVAGSGFTFSDAGEHQLKGIPQSYHLYAAG